MLSMYPMTTKFSQDVISLSDLKVNLGEVVKHVTDSRRPDHPSCHPDHPTCHPDYPTSHPVVILPPKLVSGFIRPLHLSSRPKWRNLIQSAEDPLLTRRLTLPSCTEILRFAALSQDDKVVCHSDHPICHPDHYSYYCGLLVATSRIIVFWLHL